MFGAQSFGLIGHMRAGRKNVARLARFRHFEFDIIFSIKGSLFAEQQREAKLNQLGDVLQVMAQHVDFATLAARVDLAAPRPGGECGSRPFFPKELMVGVLLIQQLFNLSDAKMGFRLFDRLSF